MLLGLGAFLAAFGGSIGLVIILSAPLNWGSYTINDSNVTGPEFLRQAGVAFGAIALLLLAIAFGVFRERAWSRQLMMLFWFVEGAVILAMWLAHVSDSSALLITALEWAIGIAIAYWYLYQRRNVVAYFDGLARAGRH